MEGVVILLKVNDKVTSKSNIRSPEGVVIQTDAPKPYSVVVKRDLDGKAYRAKESELTKR